MYDSSRQGKYARTVITEGHNEDHIGDIACLNGRRVDGWRCGKIDDIRRVDYGTTYFLEQRYAKYAGYDGDSGGAVHSPFIQAFTPVWPYSGVIAKGVASGCEDTTGDGKCTSQDTGRGIYSHIWRVEQELGVTVCDGFNVCP